MRRRPLASFARWAASSFATARQHTSRWLSETRGATPAERRCSLPGDQLVTAPQIRVTHAATIRVPPELVWPWLVQMGWHRAGWYTARWVDRMLFPANDASATQIVDELQHLRVGDFVPDGPPETECGFMVEILEPGRCLVLRSQTHLPRRWRVRGWASADWTWAFALAAVDGGRQTRLVFRWRLHAAPWPLVVGCRALVVPADLVMSRSMLCGLRARATVAQPGGRRPEGTKVLSSRDQGPLWRDRR